MALFNEILVGRYNRYLQKLLGIKGGPPAPQLATEIGASINFTSGRENALLESWFLYASSITRTASAAAIQRFRLRNPSTSNVIVVVELLALRTGGVSGQYINYVHSPQTGDLLTNETANVQNLDTRSQKPLPSAVLSSDGTSAAQQIGFAIINTQIGGTGQPRESYIVDPSHQIPIDPGSYIQAENPNQAAPFTIDVWWRERALEDSEQKA